MNRTIAKWARPIAICLTVATCTLAVAVLASDAMIESRQLVALSQRLQEVEDAAREDPSAAEAFEAEVAKQTSRSLTRNRRQSMAGITALIAAGVFVALIKVKQPSKPPVPRSVVDAVAQRAPENCAKRPVLTPPADTFVAPPVDLSPVDQIVETIGGEPRHLIPLLHAVNRQYHYLPTAAIGRLAQSTRIAHTQIAGVASFYSQFRTRPRGKHLVHVCRGTACHVAGADRILDELRRELQISPDRDTDPTGEVTIETVGCLGCCTLAPVIEIDKHVEGHVSVQGLADLVDWKRRKSNRTSVPLLASSASNGRSRVTPSTPPLEIRIGLGSCCVAGGSRDVMECLQQEIASRHLHAVIQPVGCVGICHLTPLVEVAAPGAEPIVATRATPADVRKILHALPAKAPWAHRWRNRLTDLWPRDVPLDDTRDPSCQICPIGDARLRRFVDPQVRIVTEHSGEMDPASLDQYRTRDGFAALEHCLHHQEPTSIIDTIGASGLRGRGGGGYPTATKWRKANEAPGEKLLVCNGDEGDPGAFMDRMIMESYPYRVLEGMAIAAYAVGAHRAFLYVRHEYPLAVQRLRHAIKRMTCAGLLGDNLLGSSFSLQVEVVEGAGAFVCGEETALLQSIMGQRGIPQLRPPYPVERGLFGKPTLVNNVETFANIPWIIRHGPQRFAALGTKTSKGTKVFSLAGKVRRAGLIEIPMGLTIREIVEHIGGGVADGKQFKAVQIGGPSGGCVPAELADTPIDYESLQRVGAIVGSGGLVVLDDDDCMVDVARYFLEFTQRESCGHCTFCRVGTRKLLDILERLCGGKGRPRDLDEIESLSRSVSLGSLCGLGKTAPNPVLSTLKYFRHEYEAHLKGHCPSGRCKALIRYEVTRDCVGCTLCAQHCPVGAIPLTPYRQHSIDVNACTRCDACRAQCPEEAIVVV